MNKAVFLDRDGTINVDYGYICKREDLALLDGVVEAMLMFQERGYMLIVVTNQSGVGRGYFSIEEVNEFDAALGEELAKYGVHIDEFCVCPHSPDDHCICRKPSPYLIKEAIGKYNINPDDSYMFGDRKTDVECGENAGIKSFLITTEHNLLYWARMLLGQSAPK